MEICGLIVLQEEETANANVEGGCIVGLPNEVQQSQRSNSQLFRALSVYSNSFS